MLHSIPYGWVSAPPEVERSHILRAGVLLRPTLRPSQTFQEDRSISIWGGWGGQCVCVLAMLSSMFNFALQSNFQFKVRNWWAVAGKGYWEGDKDSGSRRMRRVDDEVEEGDFLQKIYHTPKIFHTNQDCGSRKRWRVDDEVKGVEKWGWCWKFAVDGDDDGQKSCHDEVEELRLWWRE